MALAVLMFSCSKDDEPGMNGGAENTSSVVINADGSTSTGAIFSMLDETTFFLDYIKYKVVDSHIEVVGYDPIEIAADIRPYAAVTLGGATYNTRVIADKAFYQWQNMRNISIPSSVTTIGNSAFSGCTNLSSITIPNSVTTIGGSAFSGCTNLSSISIPNSVTTIGSSAFSYCLNLSSITIPDFVTTIDEYAFYNSGLTDLYFTGKADIEVLKYLPGGGSFGCLTIHVSKEYYNKVTNNSMVESKRWRIIADYNP
ncbi:MAG: leucine-rich repeat domain-containing protein [Duncaniella sp.]|nr:leucine-rich repeat domain-containing protein [Duncaniella sp.]